MAEKKKDYAVDLDVFQGPLDLLMYLIRRDEIDIYDIPIARITEQYMKYVEMLRLLNLENAGEYILMAATLIRIKAQMLLPRESRDDDELDPREELTLALLEYRKYTEAAEILRETRTEEARLTGVSARGNGYRSDETVLADSTSLFDLLNAFHDVMDAFKEDDSYFVEHAKITVEDRVNVIRKLLTDNESATFVELFADVRVKIIAVLTFLAILEMVRNQRLSVRQAVAFSEIRVYPTERLHITSLDNEAEESSGSPDAEQSRNNDDKISDEASTTV